MGHLHSSLHSIICSAKLAVDEGRVSDCRQRDLLPSRFTSTILNHGVPQVRSSCSALSSKTSRKLCARRNQFDDINACIYAPNSLNDHSFSACSPVPSKPSLAQSHTIAAIESAVRDLGPPSVAG